MSVIDLAAATPYDSLDYDALVSTCQGCTQCGLSDTRTQVVVGSGPTPCPLMIIGEGPGEQEDLQGVPFVGRAGQLLTKILESGGIQRETDAYIANIVKCRPPQNRNPLPEEAAACQDYLIRQIHLVQPRILVVLGSVAAKMILGPDQSITKIRGEWVKRPVPYMDDPLFIMPMFHPSYLLRSSSKEKGKPKWLTWQDMLEVKRALDYYQLETSES